jgi:hypothetical protein
MKAKGIGGRIDLHVEYNFKLGLVCLSIFFGLETKKPLQSG